MSQSFDNKIKNVGTLQQGNNNKMKNKNNKTGDELAEEKMVDRVANSEIAKKDVNRKIYEAKLDQLHSKYQGSTSMDADYYGYAPVRGGASQNGYGLNQYRFHGIASENGSGNINDNCNNNNDGYYGNSYLVKTRKWLNLKKVKDFGSAQNDQDKSRRSRTKSPSPNNNNNNNNNNNKKQRDHSRPQPRSRPPSSKNRR